MKLIPFVNITALTLLVCGLVYARSSTGNRLSAEQPINRSLQGDATGRKVHENHIKVIRDRKYASFSEGEDDYAAVIIEPAKTKAVFTQDSAYFRVYVAEVIGERVRFMVDIPELDVSTSYMFNTGSDNTTANGFYVSVDVPRCNRIVESYSKGEGFDVILKVTTEEGADEHMGGYALCL